MQERSGGKHTESRPRILLVDDEDAFRGSLKKQLMVRGYDVLDVDNGEDALKIVRHELPEVVVLDQKMPKMDGIQTLKEIKKLKPEVQVIMLTGHGSIESARMTGKHDVFKYLPKPCPVEELVNYIEAARQERVYALARHEIPEIQRRSIKSWLIGSHNARPGVMILGALLFAALYFMPAPDRLMSFVTEKKSDPTKDLIVGYAEYRKMKPGQTIAEYYSEKASLHRTVKDAEGKEVKELLGPEETAKRARVMIGILVVAALFWATGGIPVGITALLVGVLMYFFGVLPPDKVAQAYAKDSVIFIFGVLALASAISKTGLDRRIGMLLLGTSTSLPKMLFIFTPMLAVTASFLSEHALTAFIAPILLMVYASGLHAAGIVKDKRLAVVLFLTLTFAANMGGPGSPAAGGRNAVMLGILSDYGIQVSLHPVGQDGSPLRPGRGPDGGALLLSDLPERDEGKRSQCGGSGPSGVQEDRQDDAGRVPHRSGSGAADRGVVHPVGPFRHGRAGHPGARGAQYPRDPSVEGHQLHPLGRGGPLCGCQCHRRGACGHGGRPLDGGRLCQGPAGFHEER